MAKRKFRTQYVAKFLSNNGEWIDVDGVMHLNQDDAFKAAHSFLLLNDQFHWWPDVTRVRVMSRRVSDWELVAEGVVKDGEE